MGYRMVRRGGDLMTTPIVQCGMCRHLILDKKRRCKAFSAIPSDILDGAFDHTKKHPDQDNDILFEPID